MNLYLVPLGPEFQSGRQYGVMSENGRLLASHFCSNLEWAKRDLFYESRQKFYKQYLQTDTLPQVVVVNEDDTLLDTLIKLYLRTEEQRIEENK